MALSGGFCTMLYPVAPRPDGETAQLLKCLHFDRKNCVFYDQRNVCELQRAYIVYNHVSIILRFLGYLASPGQHVYGSCVLRKWSAWDIPNARMSHVFVVSWRTTLSSRFLLISKRCTNGLCFFCSRKDNETLRTKTHRSPEFYNSTVNVEATTESLLSCTPQWKTIGDILFYS